MTIKTPELDHLVIIATSLDEGEAWVRKRLGTGLTPGGQHAQMGTHNRLLNLGDGTYLEVIAVDPKAPPPSTPRWFGMDDPACIARAAAAPFLGAIVARVDGLDAAVRRFPELGRVRLMRRGEMEWKIAVRDDGGLPYGGAVPVLIEWPNGMHPTFSMPVSACWLDGAAIRAYHQETILDVWQELGLVAAKRMALVTTDSPSDALFKATIEGPDGMSRL
jgi:hypothetical protein